MADMRRRGPEPAAGLPRIEHKPGMADEMMHGLAPLLAEEGIDLSGDDIPDLEALQAAVNRAVERRNLELFSPVGPTRQIAVETLHGVVDAILAGDSRTAGQLLERVQPESPDNAVVEERSLLRLGCDRRQLTGSRARSGRAGKSPTPTGVAGRLRTGVRPIAPCHCARGSRGRAVRQ